MDHLCDLAVSLTMLDHGRDLSGDVGQAEKLKAKTSKRDSLDTKEGDQDAALEIRG